MDLQYSANSQDELSALKFKISQLREEILGNEKQYELLSSQGEKFRTLSQNDLETAAFKKNTAALMEALGPLLNQCKKLTESNKVLTEKVKAAKKDQLSVDNRALGKKIAIKRENIERLKNRLAELREVEDF
ncbi:hypothetical protein DSO57_1014546 [Entomophthora muscae]|uniref:Uncharacterized protein n=1 Tax=Entomophthora muscae TaxID=34485 RepID=A0ACC2SUG3_9FUNG|nr:hypothetical protein DSO57_1014546 [Entomophthora muscae]